MRPLEKLKIAFLETIIILLNILKYRFYKKISLFTEEILGYHEEPFSEHVFAGYVEEKISLTENFRAF